MKTLVGGNRRRKISLPRMANDDNYNYKKEERRKLLTDLLNAVKSCQVRYGGKSELAIDTDQAVRDLCDCLESVLQHGLIQRSLLNPLNSLVSASSDNETIPLWTYVKTRLGRHELERYMMLKNVKNDTGRARAWLRSALNEHSLERYMTNVLLKDENALAGFYETWAFVRDQELSSMLPQLASGVGSILFAIAIDNPNLDRVEKRQMEAVAEEDDGEAVVGNETNDEKRRKVPHRIVVFNDEPTMRAESLTAVAISSDEDLVSVPTLSYEDKINLTKASSPTSESSFKKFRRQMNHLGTPANVSSIKDDDDDDDEEEDENLEQEDEVDANLSVGTPTQLDGLSVSNLSIDDSTSDVPKLTPLKDSGIGALIPMSLSATGDEDFSSEDSASIRSLLLGEDVDYATASCSASFLDRQQTEDDCQVTTKVSREDLKKTLASVMGRRDELLDQVESLKSLLRNETEKCFGVRDELQDAKRKLEDAKQKQETRIQTVTRENELLKHQLKKYVSAVMKLRDGPQAYETLAKLEGKNNKTTVASPSDSGSTTISYVDYHYEASEFEKKLIQVAEMHGELLEFNEHLQKTLQTRDLTIRRLKEELVDLRGPLPEDEATEADCGPVDSRPPLVNIWVPSVFMSGNRSTTHHVYQVYFRIRDEEWNIYRRYSEFYAFHKDLMRRDSDLVRGFDFPPKKTMGNKKEKVVEDRRKRLQRYLRNIVNLMVQTNPTLATKPDKEHVVLLMPFFAENSHIRQHSQPLSPPQPMANNRSSIFGSRRRTATTELPQLAL